MERTSKLSRLFKFTWLSQAEPNETWDELLNILIDKGTVTKVDDYTITFDNTFTVLTSNHPYASGNLCMYKGKFKFITDERLHCSKATKIRLEDFYYKYLEDTKAHSYVEKELKIYKNK
jgi:hypothetical protein